MNLIKKVKGLIKPIVPNSVMKRYINWIIRKRAINKWLSMGKPLPAPDLIKYKIINDFRKKFGLKIIIETGTYLGGMIDYNKYNFKEIHTIELMEKYYIDAKNMFASYKHIHCHQGDSSKVLWELMPNIKQKTLFWLDGHYSVDLFARGEKDCPVLEELDAIFSNDLGHIILIDDARDFKGIGDYPTVEQVKNHILSKNTAYNIKVENDIIVCTI